MLALRIATFCLIGAVLLSLLYAADYGGTGWGTSFSAPLKYLPPALSALALLFYFSGARGRIHREGLAAVATLGLFAALVLAGSFYGLLIEGRDFQATFFGRGLNMLAFFAAVLVMANPEERRLVERVFMPAAFALAALIAVILIVYRLGGIEEGEKEVYHMDVVFVVGAATGLLLMRTNALMQWGIWGALVLALLAAVKTTGHLMAVLATLIALAFLAARATAAMDRQDLRRGTATHGLFAVGLVAGLTIAVLLATLLLRGRLETRTNHVRERLFEMRIDQFFDSPVFGTFFTDTPLLKIWRLEIPSHSNHLDILAAGGTLGYALFLVPTLALCYGAFRRRGAILAHGSPLDAYCPAFVLGALVTMIANPFWEIPQLGTVFWFALGTMAATGSRPCPAPRGPGSHPLLMPPPVVALARGRPRSGPLGAAWSLPGLIQPLEVEGEVYRLEDAPSARRILEPWRL